MFSNLKGTVAADDLTAGDLAEDDEYSDLNITIEYEPVVDDVTNFQGNSTCDNGKFPSQHNSPTLNLTKSLPSYNENSITKTIDKECNAKQKYINELEKEKATQFKQWNSIAKSNWELQKYLKDHKLKCEMLQLEKEKLQFEHEKYNKEFQLRVREMHWKFELDYAEKEMKERIAMRKMKIKESVNIKDLPKLHF